MNDELDMVWNEAAMTYLVYCSDISGDGRKPRRTLISTASVSAKLSFKPWYCRLRSRNANRNTRAVDTDVQVRMRHRIRELLDRF